MLGTCKVEICKNRSKQAKPRIIEKIGVSEIHCTLILNWNIDTKWFLNTQLIHSNMALIRNTLILNWNIDTATKVMFFNRSSDWNLSKLRLKLRLVIENDWSEKRWSKLICDQSLQPSDIRLENFPTEFVNEKIGHKIFWPIFRPPISMRKAILTDF